MKKLDEITKLKLIYSGELVVFAIVFLVLGILQLTGVMSPSTKFLNVFKYITLIGAAYFLYDIVSAIMNPKKRAKVCWPDKISTCFIPPYLAVVDVFLFAKNEFVINNARLFIGPLFIAISLAYLFQGIYHWYKPLPELFEDDEPKKEEKPVEVVEEKDEKNS